MAADTLALHGVDDVAAKLRAIAPALRKRVLRNTLAEGARLVRDAARARAPVLQAATKHRTPGTVKRAIVVRTSKVARRAGDVGVFINVRPARGAIYRTVKTAGGGQQRVLKRASQRGANSRTDPYYWRWLEFGTRKMPARPFLKPAANRLPQALQVIAAGVGKWLDKVERSGKVQV